MTDTLGEHYCHIEAMLLLIGTRLGDMLLPVNEANFVKDVATLDNYAERGIRLCQSLQVALGEIRSLAVAARTPSVDLAKLRHDVKALRDALLGERQQLIRDEIELYSVVRPLSP